MVHGAGAICVALVGDGAAQIHIPAELLDSVGSLAITLRGDGLAEVAALVQLLLSCRNASYLYILGSSISGLASQLSHPLQNLRSFAICGIVLPTDEFVSLLAQMPNLERAVYLPIMRTLPPEFAMLTPRRLEELSLMGTNMSPVPLLTSGRWTSRKLTLWFGGDVHKLLMEFDWPAPGSLSVVQDLQLILPPTFMPTAVFASLFVKGCAALRRLEISDRADILPAMLPDILRHCVSLRVLILGVLSVSALECDVCSVLAAAFPRALRALVLELRAPDDAALDKMRALCRARRVRLTLAGEEIAQDGLLRAQNACGVPLVLLDIHYR